MTVGYMNVKSVATEAAKLTQAGDALQGRGDFEQAVALYRQALALLGGFGPAWANMGVALRKLGRLDGAIAAYQRAIEAQHLQREIGAAPALLVLL
jgi:tetratricopeptide (TPR) repeat protein